MALIRVPTRHLAAPKVESMPRPVSIRRMLGPSVILAGLSVGSGEFVLWPSITSQWGFTLFWACWIGVTIQFFLNMEIERYTLATGESAVTGFFRLHALLGPVFFLCATIPWIWPGWAVGAGQLLAWMAGWEAGSGSMLLRGLAIAGLVLCGLLLSLGPVVYQTVERIQVVLVSIIFIVLLVLAVQVIEWESVKLLFDGAWRIGSVPKDTPMPLLLGALAFAGAGGALNLAQSNYIKDKGYGMGARVGRITSLWTGQSEPDQQVGAVFENTPENLRRWKVWWRRTNIEHFVSFYLLCLISLALFCLIAHSLLGTSGTATKDIGFILEESDLLAKRFGPTLRPFFLGTGILVLLSTELALLDGVSRVATDTLKLTFWRSRESLTTSKLYFIVLWGLIAFGAAVLLIGMDRPLTLLVLSSCLNGFVMFLYSGTLLILNWKTFHGPLRPHPIRVVAMAGAFLFFGYFSVLTLISQF